MLQCLVQVTNSFYVMFYLVIDWQNVDSGIVTNWTIESCLLKKLCGVVVLDARKDEYDLCNYNPYNNPKVICDTTEKGSF